MAKAKRRDTWDPVAALRADIRNMFRSEGGKVFHPDELHPLRNYERPRPDKKKIVQNLTAAFVGI